MPLSAKEFEKMLSLPGEIFCRCRKMKSIVQGEKHDENNWRRISVAGSGRKKITDGVSGGTSCLSVWCYRRGKTSLIRHFLEKKEYFYVSALEYDAG